jgi:hypothetical protein
MLLDLDYKFWLLAIHFTIGSNNTSFCGISDVAAQQMQPSLARRLAGKERGI